jgi:hypothetical protein
MKVIDYGFVPFKNFSFTIAGEGLQNFGLDATLGCCNIYIWEVDNGHFNNPEEKPVSQVNHFCIFR